MSNGPTCATCVHHWTDESGPLTEARFAPRMECRFNPPGIKSEWPRVQSDDWCSKHPDRVVHTQIAMAELARKIAQAEAKATPNILVPRPR